MSGAATTTVVVRGLGLASQALAVSVFGAGAQLDAFLIAQIVPNLVTAPYAGGVELGLGPGYARARAEAPHETEARRGAILRRVTQSGLAVTALLLIALPVAVRASAPGADDHVVDVAAELAWWVYPTVLFSFVSAGSSTILYATGKVHLPVIAQALRPGSLVLAILIERDVRALAIGMFFGAALEMAANLWLVRAVEGRSPGILAPSAPPSAAASRGTRLLTISSAITQMAPAIDQAVVSSLGPGKLVIFSVASRFYDVGKAAFVLPSSRLAQNRLGVASPHPRELARQAGFEVRRAAQVGVGAGVLSAAVAPLAIWLLFRRGEFSSSDAATATVVAMVLALAMVPWALASVLPRVMVLQGRTREYALLSVAYVALNAALDLALVQVWGLYGVAVSTVLAVAVFAIVQFVRVRWRAPTAAPTTSAGG